MQSCTTTVPRNERARAGRSTRFALGPPATPFEPAGHQHRMALPGHAEPHELVDHRGERVLAWVGVGSGNGQRGRLDHDRRPAAA